MRTSSVDVCYPKQCVAMLPWDGAAVIAHHSGVVFQLRKGCLSAGADCGLDPRSSRSFHVGSRGGLIQCIEEQGGKTG